MGNNHARATLICAPKDELCSSVKRAVVQKIIAPQTRPADLDRFLGRLDTMKESSDRAATATVVMGPYWGCLMNLELRDVEPAQPVDVLLIGELHTPLIFKRPQRSEMQTLALLQAAAYRAAYGAAPRCCDVFIEDTAVRYVVSKGATMHISEQHSSLMGRSTLTDLNRELLPCIPGRHGLGARPQLSAHDRCPLGNHQVRVHAFDTRYDQHLDLKAHYSGIMRYLSDASDEVIAPSIAARYNEWMRFLMGLDVRGGVTMDEFPAEMLEEYMERYLNGRRDWMAKYMQFRSDVVERIQRRARKLGVERAARIGQLVIDTTHQSSMHLKNMRTMEADASDFYLVLRMLSPNRMRETSPCRADIQGGTVPRCCIVYAGAHHVEHVRAILLAINGLRVSRSRRRCDGTVKDQTTKTLRVADIDTVDALQRVATVDDVLLGLGLHAPEPRQAWQLAPPPPQQRERRGQKPEARAARRAPGTRDADRLIDFIYFIYSFQLIAVGLARIVVAGDALAGIHFRVAVDGFDDIKVRGTRQPGEHAVASARAACERQRAEKRVGQQPPRQRSARVVVRARVAQTIHAPVLVAPLARRTEHRGVERAKVRQRRPTQAAMRAGRPEPQPRQRADVVRATETECAPRHNLTHQVRIGKDKRHEAVRVRLEQPPQVRRSDDGAVLAGRPSQGESGRRLQQDRDLERDVERHVGPLPSTLAVHRQRAQPHEHVGGALPQGEQLPAAQLAARKLTSRLLKLGLQGALEARPRGHDAAVPQNRPRLEKRQVGRQPHQLASDARQRPLVARQRARGAR